MEAYSDTVRAAPLPPVPDSLRTLARQQLSQAPGLRVRTIRKLLRDHAAYARQIQAVLIQRTQPPGTHPHLDGAWANAGEWQTLLAEFDAAVTALRRGWQSAKEAEPALTHLLSTWRERNGISPEGLFTQESEEIWAFLIPAVNDLLGPRNALLEEAVSKWKVTVARYLHLLNHSKALDGPLAREARRTPPGHAA
jgi:hypothetical protein